MQNPNFKIIIGENLRDIVVFQIGFVFLEYDLFNI